MKLDALFKKTEQENILFEGVKFTNKEINAIKKESNKFLVAFEYEFNIVKDNATAVIEDREQDKPSSEPDPREEISIHDIYEYEEYMDARDELESQALDEAFDERKREWISEREDEINEEISDDLDAVIAIAYRIKDIWNKSAYEEFFNLFYTSTFMNAFKQAFIALEENFEGATQEQKLRFIEYLNVLSNFKYLLIDKEMFEEDVTRDINSEDNFENYPSLLPKDYDDYFDYRSGYDEFEDEMDNFWRMDIPTFAGLERSLHGTGRRAPEGSEQEGIFFAEYDNDIKEFVSDYAFSDIENIMEHVLVGLNQISKFENHIYDIEDKATEDFSEVRDEILEEIHENVWNYFEPDVDLEDVIEQIQANHNVVVVNDDGEPYYVPGEGGTIMGNSVAITTRLLQEHGRKWGIDYDRDIEAVVPEHNNMVEVKSNPVPLDKAIDLMYKMFKFISDVGSTASGGSGMHTNMSIKGLSFNKREFNSAKLSVLADTELMHDLFPSRQYVNDMFSILKNTQTLIMLAQQPSTNLLLNVFSDQISYDTKYQTINFSHVDNADVSSRRIEFRFTGGKDYHTRGKVLEWTVYRLAYALKAAYDDKFEQKTYLKNVIKILDKAVKFTIGKNSKINSFISLAEFVKNNDIVDENDLYEKLRKKK